MSRGYTTSQDRSRRRMATVIIVVGVVVVVGWIAVVSALAGGSGGSRQGGAEGASREQAASTNASPETTSGDNSEDGQGEQSSADQGGAEPPVDGAETGQTVAPKADTQEVFDPLEEESPTHSASAGNDEAGSEGPAEIERTRARAASERYITAAYGYTGESAEDYLAAVEQAASEEIYDSAGGSMLKGYSQAAPECGMKSTAILEEFEVIGQSPEGLDASVTFSVEDADGQIHQFSQNQRLDSSNGAYEVSGVSVERLISDTDPRESCPGGNSEDASGGDQQAEVKPDSTGVADEDRAKAAADRYITAAYGYTGDSGKEYREHISRAADKETLYRSPGGERVQGYARSAEKDGITAAAVMESFEIDSTEGQKVEGTAYFRVGREYDRYAEIKGESTPFAVDLTLTPVRSTYEVSSASAEQEVSEQRIGGAGAKKTS